MGRGQGARGAGTRGVGSRGAELGAGAGELGAGEAESWEQGKRGGGNMREREVGSRWSGVLGIFNHDQDLHRILDRVTS